MMYPFATQYEPEALVQAEEGASESVRRPGLRRRNGNTYGGDASGFGQCVESLLYDNVESTGFCDGYRVPDVGYRCWFGRTVCRVFTEMTIMYRAHRISVSWVPGVVVGVAMIWLVGTALAIFIPEEVSNPPNWNGIVSLSDRLLMKMSISEEACHHAGEIGSAEKVVVLRVPQTLMWEPRILSGSELHAVRVARSSACRGSSVVKMSRVVEIEFRGSPTLPTQTMWLEDAASYCLQHAVIAQSESADRTIVCD